MILHCMKRKTWEEVKTNKYFGEKNIATDGFIHCSPVEYMWRVAPYIKDAKGNWIKNEEL